eukprot:1159982-Pelagomonas_calceolata.AAC.5
MAMFDCNVCQGLLVQTPIQPFSSPELLRRDEVLFGWCALYVTSQGNEKALLMCGWADIMRQAIYQQALSREGGGSQE